VRYAWLAWKLDFYLPASTAKLMNDHANVQVHDRLESDPDRAVHAAPLSKTALLKTHQQLQSARRNNYYKCADALYLIPAASTCMHTRTQYICSVISDAIDVQAAQATVPGGRRQLA
jgi:hypothetical protein